MKKTLTERCALIALCMALSFVSCGETNVGEIQTTEESTDEVTTENITVPEVRDLENRKINILIRSEWDYEFMVDEENGDTVSDAIHQRNTTVEDKYNCKLNFIDFAGDWSNHDTFANTIHNSVLAGDGAYDMIAGYQACLAINIQSGDLMNLYDVPNLYLDSAHWTQEGLDSLTYNGVCYEVGGDIAVSLLKGINCMYFNKTLADEYKVPNLYEIVDNGEWTLPKLLEVTKDVYVDLNSNDTSDENDQYGFASYMTYTRNYVVAFETPTIVDGKLAWNNEHTVSVIEKLVSLFNDEPDVYYAKKTEDAEKMFTESRVLLMHSVLGTAEKMRSMDDDFGILPLPKFDESQESYHTTTLNDVSMMCIPITAPNLDISGLVMEAMCYESTDTVAKAFYDTALKGKYARDDDSLRMIELIRKVLTFDFGAINSIATGVSGAQYQTMIADNNVNFASWYASEEQNIKDRVEIYLEYFKK